MSTALVIGAGGREHAIAWALVKSPHVLRRVYCMPGNGGTASSPRMENIPLTSLEGCVEFAAAHGVDLTVVGPETYLAQGIVDRFQSTGLMIFGPPRATARLESSKAFALEFAHRHSIPTPSTHLISDYTTGIDYLMEQPEKRWFIKADELCGGKGAIFAPTLVMGKEALHLLLQQRACGLGKQVLIQEAIDGEEVSIMVITDGQHYRILPLARDYKRLKNGDRGPNTGGMGGYAPVSLSPQMRERIERRIIAPTIQGMAVEGLSGAGIIYFGIIIDRVGDPYLLEYNVRFGDPETQALLPLLKSDLYALLTAACEGTLDQASVEWYPGACACVVASSAGYPVNYGNENLLISGVNVAKDDGTFIFHAATSYIDGRWYARGGRILAVAARGESLEQARERAYESMARISFAGMHYRRDIVAREETCVA